MNYIYPNVIILIHSFRDVPFPETAGVSGMKKKGLENVALTGNMKRSDLPT